jgi:t-SNARE complex subunit (syntaxin)
MTAVFKSRETQGKLDSDQRKELSARMQADRESAVRGESAYTKANAGYMGDQQQQQTQIRREQDVVLDKMSSGLDTLKEMAVAIDSELQDQGRMIDDIDKEVDEAQSKMDSAIKGIEKLLKTKDRCQLMTIGGLVLIFIIVTAVAFSSF